MLTYAEAKKIYDALGMRQDGQSYYEDPAFDLLIQNANLDQAEEIVELGCGTGWLAKRLLADQLPRNARYHGIDLSPTMVQITLERLAEYSHRVEVKVSDGSPRFDIPDQSMDCFLSTYVLDILSSEDIQNVISEAHRILKRNGELCLVDLTYGKAGWPRLYSLGWELVHTFYPAKVGGCRPIRVSEYLPITQWQIKFQSVLTTSGIPSEVIIDKAL